MEEARIKPLHRDLRVAVIVISILALTSSGWACGGHQTGFPGPNFEH